MTSPRYAPDVIGELRAEMARQRLTHAAAADIIGVAGPGISRRFSGATPLSLDEYLTLCDWLGQDPAAFLATAMNRRSVSA